MGAGLLLAPLLAPLLAATVAAAAGWRRGTGLVGVAAAATILLAGVGLAARVMGSGPGAVVTAGMLRADPLAAVMLIVIGAVALLATWAGLDYLDGELAGGQTTPAGARRYAVLVSLFLATMVLAVLADNLGVVWVSVEATTVSTAFLVGHRRTRAAIEASWKYVVVCSVGIGLAFLGTVLAYFASTRAGSPSGALDLSILLARAPHLDPGVMRLAGGLLLLGFGTKVGLVPFHSWLADAHSQAPAPVSALMSGVLLSVAFSVLLRVKQVLDLSLGAGFFRVGLLVMGLLTLAVAAFLLVGQRDYKRMLAYSSLEHMGLLALAAAAGTRLAVAALLLHVLAHGLGKAVLFVTAGQLQHVTGSTAIRDVTGLLSANPVLGLSLAGGLVALLGLPPFALFASEVGIVRGAAAAHLIWPTALALVLVLVAFGALARHALAMLLGEPAPDPGASGAGPVGLAVASGWAARLPMVLGLAACLALGISAGPLTGLLHLAAAGLGAAS